MPRVTRTEPPHGYQYIPHFLYRLRFQQRTDLQRQAFETLWNLGPSISSAAPHGMSGHIPFPPTKEPRFSVTCRTLKHTGKRAIRRQPITYVPQTNRHHWWWVRRADSRASPLQSRGRYCPDRPDESSSLPTVALPSRNCCLVPQRHRLASTDDIPVTIQCPGRHGRGAGDRSAGSYRSSAG